MFFDIRRCTIPECEDQVSESQVSGLAWLNNTVPEKTNCMRYAPKNSPLDVKDCMRPDIFDRNKTIPCDNLIYDHEEVTIQNEVRFGKCCSINYFGIVNSYIHFE